MLWPVNPSGQFLIDSFSHWPHKTVWLAFIFIYLFTFLVVLQ